MFPHKQTKKAVLEVVNITQGRQYRAAIAENDSALPGRIAKRFVIREVSPAEFDEMPSKIVTLVSCDHKEFKVDAEVAKMSKVVANMFEPDGMSWMMSRLRLLVILTRAS